MLSARRLAHRQMDHGGARIGAGRRAEAELVGRKRQGGMIAFQLAGAVGGYRDNGCSHQPALPIAASTASPRRSTMISISAAFEMKGGASSTWSPCLPSMVPPIG